MATLTKDGRSGGFLVQWYENKRRQTIWLSGRKYRQATAEQVKKMVETLIYYRDNGILMPEKAVAQWLNNASTEIREKLAQAGLIAVTKLRTCQELWDTCLKHKTNVKDSTMTTYRDCQRVFFKTFSPAEPIDDITVERLLDWKTAMLAAYKEASVAAQISAARMVFDWAVEMEWLSKNPVKKIPKGSYVNQENDRTISMEDYAKMLDACPNQDWRTIIALARIGGLRCPSELRRLRWSDINWAENRFLVRASKTERYARHRERVVPLFPVLRAELDRHFFSLDETEENEFVIERFQRTSWH
jgi:hypothetical protein